MHPVIPIHLKKHLIMNVNNNKNIIKENASLRFKI